VVPTESRKEYEMNKVFALIRRAVKEDPGADTHALATVLMESFRKTDMLPLVEKEVAHQQRAYTREQEASWSRSLADRFRRSTAAIPSPAEVEAAIPDGLKALMQSRFRLGDGGTVVSWGGATMQQHELRIEMLKRQRAGIDLTIRRHHEAIDLLRQTGATTLDEVFATQNVAQEAEPCTTTA